MGVHFFLYPHYAYVSKKSGGIDSPHSTVITPNPTAPLCQLRCKLERGRKIMFISTTR
jgi:hypothetical protein